VLHDLGVQGTALAALAKPKDSEPTANSQQPTAASPHPASARAIDTLYLAGRKNPVKLRPGSPALHLLARVRDETHRFAVTFQGRVRGKRRLTDRLSHVPGIGPVTRRRLLAAFGSVARLAQATIEQLLAVEGVTEPQAQAVLAHLARDAAGESQNGRRHG
jgi:excinuclease ABC subunit C